MICGLRRSAAACKAGGSAGPEKGVVVFAKGHAGALQLALDEGMAVQVIGDGERQEGAHAQGHRSQHFITNIEVIVGIAGRLPGEDAVVGIVDGESGNGGTKGRPQFHALEDEVDTEPLAALHAPQVRADVSSLRTPFSAHCMGIRRFLAKASTQRW
jgi:hypothetical protein